MPAWRVQCLHRLAKPAMTPPGEMKGVIYSATRNPLIRPPGTFPRKRGKEYCADAQSPYYRRLAGSVFIPLGGNPSIYPAWP